MLRQASAGLLRLSQQKLPRHTQLLLSSPTAVVAVCCVDSSSFACILRINERVCVSVCMCLAVHLVPRIP